MFVLVSVRLSVFRFFEIVLLKLVHLIFSHLFGLLFIFYPTLLGVLKQEVKPTFNLFTLTSLLIIKELKGANLAFRSTISYL